MKKFFICFLSITMMAVACSKSDNPPPVVDEDDDSDDPTEVSFDARLTENKTFKVGERVEFTLQGNPESIDFFSGEEGHEYEYRAGTPMPSGMELRFSIRFNLSASSWPVDNPDWGPLPWDKLALLVSTDFDGDYTFASVSAAEWVDVTDRMTFPPIQSSTQPAGPINLSDLTEIGKPFYFAFRLQDDHPKRPAFLIQNPEWYSILGEDRELIGYVKAGDPGENTFNFQQVDEDPDYPAAIAWTAGPQYNDRFSMRRNNSAASLGKQSWYISKKFDGVQEIMGGGSVSIPIKSVGNEALSRYSQTYQAPGTYHVYFVATVLDEDGERSEVVKSITVVVEE